MMRMGIDYGQRRIGIAISDPSGCMALPLETIIVKADDSHFERIKTLICDYHIAEIIVGLPYNMDGTLGASGQAVLDWSERIKTRFGLPVIMWDERLTTCQAHSLLDSVNMKAKKRRQVVDQLAASVILSDYLSARHA